MNQQKNIFPLTPEIDKELQEIAKTLPKFQKRNKKGQPLNRVLKVQEVEIAGKKQNLKICEPVLVNHYINLVGDYRQHGRVGVDAYLAEVKRMMDEFKNDPNFAVMNGKAN